MKRTFAFILLATCLLQVHSQESCTEKLFHANKLYEAGKFDEAIQEASSCTQTTTITRDRWQSYRLLTLCYLATGESSKSRFYAEEMLRINPVYKPSELYDHTEFIKLIQSVRIIPKLSIGLAASVGGNYSQIHLLETYNGGDFLKNYSSKSTWQTGITCAFSLNEIISLRTGILATTKAFNMSYTIPNSDYQVSINESLSYLDIPFFARFSTYEWNKFRLFADAGGFAGRLVNARSDFSRTSNALSETVTSNNLNAMNRRNPWEYGVLYGLGAIYRIGQINIALDVRYYLSYANITNPANRYTNQNLFYTYNYFDDNLRLNNYSVSLSLIYDVNYKVIHKQ